MIQIRTLASTMLAAFGAIGGARTALHAAATEPTATVVSVSVVPTTGRADVVIRIDGAIALKHFTLTNPDKIVIDLSGATLGLPTADAYDGVSRGGITRIRYSQFTKTVVRVVLTLDAMRTYEVTQSNGEVHVSVAGNTEQFDSWQVSSKSAAPAALAMVQPDRVTCSRSRRGTPRSARAKPSPPRSHRSRARSSTRATSRVPRSIREL